MKKEGSLGMRKNIFEKKVILLGFRRINRKLGLPRLVNQFTPG